MRTQTVHVSGLALSLLLFAPTASAESVVKAGGKPGVATSWSGGTENTVKLKIGDEYDVEEVAEAISTGVPGAKARVEGDTVVVSGVKEADLLKALEKIEVEAGGDDVDDMLAAMQQPGGAEEGSGSSIRATQAADFSEVLGKKTELITAKVVDVQRHRFPLVLVKVKLRKVPKGVKGLKRGTTITVVPRVKSRNGVINPKDKASKLNVGAWYAQPGDKVLLRLEAEPKDKVWIAAAFDRGGRKMR